MKKKSILVSLILVMLFSLTGCLHSEQTINYNVDGSYTVNAILGIRADSISKEDAEADGMVLQSINGIDYYVQEETKVYKNADELKKDSESVIVGDGIFYYDMSSSGETDGYNMNELID